jgi:hypothetical protein
MTLVATVRANSGVSSANSLRSSFVNLGNTIFIALSPERAVIPVLASGWCSETRFRATYLYEYLTRYLRLAAA